MLFRKKQTPQALQKILRSGVGRLDRDAIPPKNPTYFGGGSTPYMLTTETEASVLGLKSEPTPAYA